jgi:hypothetical protein
MNGCQSYPVIVGRIGYLWFGCNEVFSSSLLLFDNIVCKLNNLVTFEPGLKRRRIKYVKLAVNKKNINI